MSVEVERLSTVDYGCFMTFDDKGETMNDVEPIVDIFKTIFRA